MNTVAEIEAKRDRKETRLRLTQKRLEWTLIGKNWNMFDFVRNKIYSSNLEDISISVIQAKKTIFGSQPALFRIAIWYPKKTMLIVKFPYEQNQEVLNFFSKCENAKKKREMEIRYQKDEKERLIKYHKNSERAKIREKARDYESAIEIWEDLGEIEEAARVRKMQAELGSVKVAQKVVQGDEVTKTEIKDSVVSKSNIGSGGDDKFARLEKLTDMKKEGLIDDDEFKQMKKEILGK